MERLITHLSVWSLHVCMVLGLPLGGSPGAGLVAAVLVEGVGAMDVAGTLFPTIIPYGKYMCLLQIPPSPYLQQVLHQCHLGKFLYIIC